MNVARAEELGAKLSAMIQGGAEPKPAEVIELIVGAAINLARVADAAEALKKDRLGS